MTNTTAAVPTRLQSIPLQGCCLVNSVVVDSEGNIYYSDEVNQSVVSLDATANIRWQKIGKGSGPGEFHYPRGLSLGQCEHGGRIISVLAVSDAWNHRVQLLDLSGDLVDIWTGGNDLPFAEITDVRFIRSNPEPDDGRRSGDLWFVSDRGNHRIVALGQDGKFRFQFGRFFPPALELGWALPELFFKPSRVAREFRIKFPPLDFLFYPARFLDDRADHLYVFDPGADALKLARPPHLLPLDFGLETRTDWIGADATGFLGWQSSANLLVRTDRLGEISDWARIDGTPVPSNMPLSMFWIQRELCLELWNWNRPEPRPAGSAPPGINSLLTHSARADFARLDLEKFRQAVTDCILISGEELAIADTICRLARKNPDLEAINYAIKCIPWVRARRVRAQENLGRTLHSWSVGMLKCCVSGTDPELPARLRDDVLILRRVFSEQIRFRLREIDDCSASLLEKQHDLAGMEGVDAAGLEGWIRGATAAGAELTDLRNWMVQWSGLNPGQDGNDPQR